MAQSGLSEHLRALEIRAGEALIVRQHGRCHLTATGARWARQARHALAANLAPPASPAQTLPHAHSLRVGVGPTPTALLLPRVAPDFHARHPGVQLQLRAGLHERLRPALEQGELDLALMAVPENANWPMLHSRVLFRSALTVAGRFDHPWRHARHLAQLTSAEWILMGAPGGPGGTITRFFAEQGLPPPRVAAVCESFTEVGALLAHTDWLALLPREIVRLGLLGSQVRAWRLQEEAFRFANCLVTHHDRPLTGPGRDFAAMCESWARMVAGQE